MHGRDIILSILVLVVIIPPLLSGAANASTCESCHTGSRPDGGYTFSRPMVSLGGAGVAQPGSNISIDLSVRSPGRYDIRNFAAELDLSKAPGMSLASGENMKKTLPNMDTKPQTHGLSWQLVSGTTGGTMTVGAKVTYTVHFTHNSGGSKDTANYYHALSHIIEVQSMPVDITPSSLQAMVGSSHSFTVNITARQDVYNIRVAAGLSIENFTQVSPATVGTLMAGQTKAVTVTMTPTRALEQGTLAVICSTDKEGTSMTTVNLGIKVLEAPVTDPDTGNTQAANLRLAARALGFIGLVLLILLLPTGGFLKALAKPLNKAFGSAKKRVDLHCAMSYLLLSTGLLHSAILMYGHYSGAVWNGVFLIAVSDYLNINLGTIAVVLMCVISLLGILQKRLCKVIGRKAWGWTHGIISYLALALIIVHLLWIGTTSAPLRAFIL